MARHRAQHRLTPQRRLLAAVPLGVRNPAWHLAWVIPAAVTVVGLVFGVTWAVTGPTPANATQAAVQSPTPAARPDPTTTETARAYLDALGVHRVALEPHQAVFVGEAVCAQRKRYNASLATLSASVQEYVPGIRKIDAATLVDDADKHLCQEGK